MRSCMQEKGHLRIREGHSNGDSLNALPIFNSDHEDISFSATLNVVPFLINELPYMIFFITWQRGFHLNETGCILFFKK
jgi:hypothetical protein